MRSGVGLGLHGVRTEQVDRGGRHERAGAAIRGCDAAAAGRPAPAVAGSRRVEGTWHLEGEDLTTGDRFTGTITREWLPGGHFLVQRTETDGHPQVGAEYIGYDTAAGSLRSMLFSDEGPGPFCPF